MLKYRIIIKDLIDFEAEDMNEALSIATDMVNDIAHDGGFIVGELKPLSELP